MLGGLVLFPAAFLVLAAASARAGIVAADLVHAQRLRFDHDPLGEQPAAPLALELATLMVAAQTVPVAKTGDKLNLALLI